MTKIKLILTITLLSLLFTIQSALADNAGKLYLTISTPELPAGEERIVEVWVEDVSLVYGIDVQLSFNPDTLAIIDMDDKQEGIQLNPSNFFSPKEGHFFFLKNEVDIENGIINYVVTLVNPAVPVQGNGLIVQIPVKAKIDGPITMHLEKGQFGTKEGLTLDPILDESIIQVKTASNPPVQSGTQLNLDGKTSTINNSPPQPEQLIETGSLNSADNNHVTQNSWFWISVLGLITFTVILAGGASILVGIGLWFSYKPKTRTP